MFYKSELHLISDGSSYTCDVKNVLVQNEIIIIPFN